MVAWMIAGVGALAGALIVVLALVSDHVDRPGVQAALMLWIVLPYVGAGLLGWQRRPDSRLGPIMVAAGLVNVLAVLAWSNVAALSTVGLACDFLPVVLFIHVYLAFPSGRLEGGVDRLLVGVAYGASVGFSVVRMLLGAFGGQSLLAVVDEPVLVPELERVQLLVMSLIALLTVVVLIARWRAGWGRQRRSRAVLVDSFAVALVMIAALYVTAAFGGHGFETLRRLTFGALGIAPVVFLVEMGRVLLARASVGGLMVELRDDPPLPGLRDALARALRDPTLAVAYWLPQFDSWADADGSPLYLPGPESGRGVTLIDRNGVAVAALMHDPVLSEDRGLIEAVSAAAGIALENGRLASELRARVEELAGSRARILAAGQVERQRLERNLHDGAQQRLVALSLELGLLEDQLADDPAAVSRLSEAKRTVAQSLAELRDVARGIHPAVVSGHGLAVALEELTAHGAVPVVLSVDLPGRLAEAVEVAAYYFVSESLANVGKHSEASEAVVTVAWSAGWLVAEVVDDGVGGANADAGSGLRGLADRVEALGGRVQVWSPRGNGTRVRAEMPCGS
jgi:signal transduction histidine kinase